MNSALFPKDDPSLRHATPATVAVVDLAGRQGLLPATFRPDLAAIVVIGNVPPEEAKAVITKYFGGWKAEGAKPETDLPTAPPNKPADDGGPQCQPRSG